MNNEWKDLHTLLEDDLHCLAETIKTLEIKL
jgi:hypothetical protein